MLKKFFLQLIIVVATIVMYSCNSLRIIPQAVNTINSVRLDELNLERKDYIILNTISAEAVIIARYSDNEIRITEQNNEFAIKFNQVTLGQGANKSTGWTVDKVDGVARFGFLSNDYNATEVGPYPHYMVRNLAIYRLINASKVAGADGVIEPVISTNIEQGDKKNEVVYKTTVSAKLIKLKPDGK